MIISSSFIHAFWVFPFPLLYVSSTDTPLTLPPKPSSKALKSQLSGRSRDLCQMIPVQRLHYLPQPLMAVIFVVPHILVILNSLVLVQSQAHEAIDWFGKVQQAWGVFLPQLEDELGGCVGDDFGRDGARGGHYFGYPWISLESMWLVLSYL